MRILDQNSTVDPHLSTGVHSPEFVRKLQPTAMNSNTDPEAYADNFPSRSNSACDAIISPYQEDVGCHVKLHANGGKDGMALRHVAALSR